MQIYNKNSKYEKSLALINQIIEEYEPMDEPNTLLFLYKEKYKIQVNLERLVGRDAEMTLLNSIALVERHQDEFKVMAPHEILTVHCDLLLHYLNHGNKQIRLNSSKADK